MKLEDQVCSLELAKRLKKLGVKQKSYFFWVGREIWDECMQSDYETPSTPSRDKWNSAFTVAELGEILPISTGYGKNNPTTWSVYYKNTSGELEPNLTDKYEANARAKMLLHLIEEGIVQPC